MKTTKFSYSDFRRYFEDESFDISITTKVPESGQGNLIVLLKRRNKKNKNLEVCKLFEIPATDRNYILVKDARSKIKAKLRLGNRFPNRAVSLIFATYLLNSDYNARSKKKKLLTDTLKFLPSLGKADYYADTSNQRPFFSKLSGLKIIELFSDLAIHYPFKKEKIHVNYPPQLVKEGNPILLFKDKKKRPLKKKTSMLLEQEDSLNLENDVINKGPTQVTSDSHVKKDKLVYYADYRIDLHLASGETVTFSATQSKFIKKIYDQHTKNRKSHLVVLDLKNLIFTSKQAGTTWHSIMKSKKNYKFNVFTEEQGRISIKSDLIPWEDQSEKS